MKEDFLQKIDGNLESMGFGDRAAFIRTAVQEKLARAGVQVSPSMTAPPSRAGKGGRPPGMKAAMLNESNEPSEAAKIPAKSMKYPAVKKKPKAP